MPLNYGPMPAVQVPNINPIGNALGAYGAVQGIQNQRTRNELYQSELGRRKKIENVMAGEGGMEDKIQQVLGIDPEAGYRMAQAFKAMKPDQLKKMQDLTRWVMLTEPMLENPAQVDAWKEDLTKVAPEYAKLVPDSSQLQTPEAFAALKEKLKWNATTANALINQQTAEKKIAGSQTLAETNTASRERIADLNADVKLTGMQTRGQGRSGKEPDYDKKAENLLKGSPDWKLADPDERIKMVRETAAKLRGQAGAGGQGRVDKVGLARQKLSQIPAERRQEAMQRIQQNDPELYQLLMQGQ